MPLVRWTLCGSARGHALVHPTTTSRTTAGVHARAGEIAALYAAETGARPAPDAPALQYADFARWQRALPGTDEGRRQLAHWIERLADAPPMPDLPADRPRPAWPTGRGGQVTIALDRELTGELRALALQRGATVFTTMLASFAALLHGRTGARDLVIGSGLANRRLPETHALIGMFVNTVALRIDAAGDPSAGELSTACWRRCSTRRSIRSCPSRRSCRRSRRDAAPAARRCTRRCSPSTTRRCPTRRRRPAITPDETRPNGSAKADVNVVVVHRDGALQVLWEYSSDLFEPETASRDGGRLRRAAALVRGAAGEPLSAHAGAAPPAHAYERDGTIAGVFADRVAEAPDAVALEWDGGALTYAELDAAADALARRLVARAPDRLARRRLPGAIGRDGRRAARCSEGGRRVRAARSRLAGAAAGGAVRRGGPGRSW